uniref:Uncharacterized protein n=1 Tax=Anguilla anguilla TaxID=7936 RepID=A0A0E9SU32_ANGAN
MLTCVSRISDTNGCNSSGVFHTMYPPSYASSYMEQAATRSTTRTTQLVWRTQLHGPPLQEHHSPPC